MNKKRTIATWFSCILGFLVLFIALGNGLDILGSNAGAGSSPWGIKWTIVNVQTWVNILWGILILIKCIPNWLLLTFGLLGTALFIYYNFYIKDFYWFQILILVVICLFFAYETYKDYVVR